MLLIRFLRFLFGYVRFTVTGGFPERFVNLCTGMRIPVWDIRPDDGALHGKTKIHAYRSVRHAARRAGMRLRLQQKCGLPFLLHRHRERFGLAVGAAICAVLLCVLSQHIWVIDVAGGDGWMRECVLDALAEIGIREGTRASEIQSSRAERALLLRLPQTEWIALNVNGSVLHVEWRAKQTVPQQDDYNNPCHIVAAKDGFLSRLETYEGMETAQLRTAVQQGQLLISGAVDHADGSVSFRHAKGYAEAQTTQHIHVQRDAHQTFDTFGSVRTRARLDLFSLRLPLGKARRDGNAIFFSYTQTIKVRDVYLPIYRTVYRSILRGTPRALSPGQQKLLTISDFGQQAAASLRECRILHADVQPSLTNCDGTFQVIENIGQEQPILTES